MWNISKYMQEEKTESWTTMDPSFSFNNFQCMKIFFIYILYFSVLYGKRQWQPTPVLLTGKSHGWRRLVGFSPWGCWVRHDWVTSLSLFTFMHWRRKWQPTPVFLPGESQGRGSLVGCRWWGRTESDKADMT